MKTAEPVVLSPQLQKRHPRYSRLATRSMERIHDWFRVHSVGLNAMLLANPNCNAARYLQLLDRSGSLLQSDEQLAWKPAHDRNTQPLAQKRSLRQPTWRQARVESIHDCDRPTRAGVSLRRSPILSEPAQGSACDDRRVNTSARVCSRPRDESDVTCQWCGWWARSTSAAR